MTDEFMTDEQPTTGATREPSHNPRQEVSYGVQVAAWWSLCFLLITAAVLVIARILGALGMVTVAVAIGIMIAAMLQPAVSWLVRRRWPRGLAAVAVFLGGLLIVGLLVWFVVAQIRGSWDVITDEVTDAGDDIRHWLVTGPAAMSQADVDDLGGTLGDAVSDNRTVIASGVLSAAGSVLGLVSGAVFCLFALLFLLADDGGMWRWARGLLPAKAQPPAEVAGPIAWRTLSVYMRSLVLLAFINAIAMVPVMLVVGMPLVVPCAVLLFLGSLIPLIGVIIAGVVVALIAFSTVGVGAAIVVTVALVLIVQLFGNLLNPVILGRFVALHPLAILVGVTGGTVLGGAFGAFVAVPLIAVVNNVVRAVRAEQVGHLAGRSEAETEAQLEAELGPVHRTPRRTARQAGQGQAEKDGAS